MAGPPALGKAPPLDVALERRLSSLLATCESEGSRIFPPIEPVYSA
jgi:hypothetical protein